MLFQRSKMFLLLSKQYYRVCLASLLALQADAVRLTYAWYRFSDWLPYYFLTYQPYFGNRTTGNYSYLLSRIAVQSTLTSVSSLIDLFFIHAYDDAHVIWFGLQSIHVSCNVFIKLWSFTLFIKGAKWTVFGGKMIHSTC